MFHSVADLLEATPREREMYEHIGMLERQAAEASEQLDAYRETLADLTNLALHQAKYLDLSELRAELKSRIAV